jgi:hypothetical protein
VGALLVARRMQATPWWWIAIGFVAFQALGAAFIAPLAVGELDVQDAPIVFAVVSGLGIFPAAAASGALLGQRLATRQPPTLPVAG